MENVNRGLFNKECIVKMKKGVYLVNNVWGVIVDMEVVKEVCELGYFGGNLIIFENFCLFFVCC